MMDWTAALRGNPERKSDAVSGAPYGKLRAKFGRGYVVVAGSGILGHYKKLDRALTAALDWQDRYGNDWIIWHAEDFWGSSLSKLRKTEPLDRGDWT